uniref:Thyroglobulin type-1 domain-containing protein n=1 Tax=Scleropages formosus TaxID=113540 RepID=A0A8C9S278_SCLFO
MAEQDDGLLQRAESGESVNMQRSPQRGSTAHALKISGLTMLACLLVAGQALIVYQVVNQGSRLTNLQNTASDLQKRVLQNPRGSSAPKSVRMPLYSMPLLMDMSDDSKMMPMTKLENTAMVNVETQVKELLQGQDLPQFNETFLSNLKALKSQMEESEWKGFESWMHHWLIFQMAQQAPPKPTADPDHTTAMGASTIQTKCQVEAAGVRGVKPGFYRPQCDKDGNYLPMQCHHSTGYCWCVDKNGEEIPNTKIRGRPICGGMPRVRMALPSFAKTLNLNGE